ncbi:MULTISPECIES: hypothetical protein [Vibrio]|nr:MULTISPECIES: hypothetical protein [Vibrio]EGQ7714469.1 hypothetical protein [Vibrio parahaemolyticus]EGQ7719329.1 hypothetical protein [Vibrio parahaemolyticus]EGQ7723104.1 hypothetical protein [Vibrio parahaemolyticus]EGQ7728173.1 hypothetical protein [Vibrio parahaemolyticus]EGQ7734313.1 hypothetical protein [Vibrio parahaemolyticus]
MSNRRSSEGDETWFRLLNWTKGQKAAERISAHILKSEQYHSVDPSHPLGGRDGGKDILCAKNSKKYVGAVYFPRGQKSFREIKSKFDSDALGVINNKADGIVFITNQELSLSQRHKLDESVNFEVTVYHLERVSSILDQPSNYGVRLEYLDVELTKEEQLAFFAQQEHKLNFYTEKLELLAADYSEFKNYTLNMHEHDYDRSVDEILIELDDMIQKVWYNRHLNLRYKVEFHGEKVAPEIWEGALASAKKVEDKFGKENLCWDDFEWGMLNGKVSALRWVLGEEWDMLDT